MRTWAVVEKDDVLHVMPFNGDQIAAPHIVDPCCECLPEVKISAREEQTGMLVHNEIN